MADSHRGRLGQSIGTMKHSADTLIAIWCAAAGTSPSRPISSAVAMNSPPSIVTVTPDRQAGAQEAADGRAVRAVVVIEELEVGKPLGAPQVRRERERLLHIMIADA
jgi:hypothetical protein